MRGFKIMNTPKIISFQTQLDEFYFLGIENLVTENANFVAFWDNFFNKGGYDLIDPYQTDPNCVNIWFNNINAEKIYYQGKFVNSSAKIPDGYTLKKFPSSEYLVTTTEWLPSYEETMNHINPNYYKNAQTPAGYRTRNENDKGIFLIERWGEKTNKGYRYEFWVPIEKILP